MRSDEEEEDWEDDEEEEDWEEEEEQTEISYSFFYHGTTLLLLKPS